ncbi:DUF1194 domain-containing protein [Pontivivens insulae]|uniref:VWFA domain-containing protein n=1 Tax=Pontivivens insulae TaxID=1639689 RepID=A0A2R8AC56_9RHOB|nr:DUF1194 domain-containing protein [Pontivivens insulae]RED13736.1 Ca-activated chloride channel family protein [Pontivivens insulae]SPF29811.1 hypothetical protein POI8812_02129 [Pontivivens insulae]
MKAAIIALCLAAAPASASCRLALALGMDISSSVNAAEYELQLRGMARAFREPDIIDAVLAIPDQYVLVLPYEWSGRLQQEAIGEWARLETAADVVALADRLDAHTRRYENFSTGIGQSLIWVQQQFDALPVSCDRLVVDLSGDGITNDGPDAIDQWPDLAARGITVNALAIVEPTQIDHADQDVATHYRNEVITGPGAFMLVARIGFEDYPELIRGKLLRELAPQMLIGAVEP